MFPFKLVRINQSLAIGQPRFGEVLGEGPSSQVPRPYELFITTYFCLILSLMLNVSCLLQ